MPRMAGARAQVWLGHSCPSVVRLVAWTFLSKHTLSAGTLYDAQTGATTFLSSQNPSAGCSKWLEHPCPSSSRRRGRFMTPKRVRRHSCRRGFYRRGRRCCDAKKGVAPVAWTFLSKQFSSAGTPTLRRTAYCACTTPRMASHQRCSSAGTPTLRVCRRRGRRRYEGLVCRRQGRRRYSVRVKSLSCRYSRAQRSASRAFSSVAG